MKFTSSKTGCNPLLGKLANHTTVGLFSLAISFPLCLPAQEQPSANAANHGITVKSQPLYSALTAFAEQSGIQFVYDAALVDGLKTRGISQEHDTKQALRHLLANSGLDYRFTDNTVVLFKPEHVELNGENDPYLLPVVQVTGDAPDKRNGTTLPKVTVEADAAYDPEYYADPYNKDYVIPNATAGTKTDTQNIFLRGFPSETIFRNGFRLKEGSTSKEMSNVESVEVLKGPAAILYGQVEPGGMVNVVTKQPLATPYYGFSQQFGSYDLYRTTMDATGPITKDKDLLYRVNMSYENSGSFRDFVNKEDVFFAPVLKWNISPKTQATFELEYNHQHLGLDTGYLPLLNGVLINLPRNVNYGEYSPATVETIFGGFNWSHQFNDDWAIKHRFSANQQMFNSQMVIPDTGVNENGDIPRFLQNGQSQNNTYSTSLDLTGHFDTVGLKHTLLFGGDYYRLDLGGVSNSVFDDSTINFLNPVHPGIPAVPPGQRFVLPFSFKTDQYGLYVQDQIKLSYNVHVMGGIRYQYIHQNSDIRGTTTGQTDDAVTPRVGFLWQPKSWISLYANYAESFGPNSGSVFISPTESKPVPPTSAEQYEGGIKTEFFDGRLRATIYRSHAPAWECRQGCSASPCQLSWKIGL